MLLPSKIVDGEIKGNANALPTLWRFMGEEELGDDGVYGTKAIGKRNLQQHRKNYQYCIAIPIGTAFCSGFWNDDVMARRICGDMVGP